MSTQEDVRAVWEATIERMCVAMRLANRSEAALQVYGLLSGALSASSSQDAARCHLG